MPCYRVSVYCVAGVFTDDCEFLIRVKLIAEDSEDVM